MEIRLSECEICHKKAKLEALANQVICPECARKRRNEKQKRKENWIRLSGGGLQGINVWLEKPRKHKEGVCDSYMLTIGWQNREYDFCSIKCLIEALRGNVSL